MSSSVKDIVSIIYIAGFVSLASLGAWDVYTIIDQFLNDNRMTTVSRRNSTESFPFVVNPSITVNYADRPLFPFRPIDSDEYIRMTNASWRRIGGGAGISTNTSPSAVNDDTTDNSSRRYSSFFAATFFSLVVKPFYEEGSDALDRLFPLFDGAFGTKEQLAPLIDKFIAGNDKNDDPSDLPIFQAQRELREFFIRNPSQEIPDPIFFDLYTPTAYTYTFPLRNGWNPIDPNARGFFTDAVYVSSDDSSERAAASAANFMIKFGSGDTIVIKAGPPNVTTFTTIVVSNDAVFDSARFPPCDSQFDGGGDDEERCAWDRRIRMIADECGCAIFSEYAIHTFLDTTSNNISSAAAAARRQPFCKYEKYADCWEKANERAVKEAQSASSIAACTPCVKTKNTYRVTTEPMDGFFDLELGADGGVVAPEKSWKPRAGFGFKCTQREYLVFEDKPQTSTSQLISQVGGDLGLYVGFSMLSLLQIILFAYQIKRGERQEEQQRENASKIDSQNDEADAVADGGGEKEGKMSALGAAGFVRRYVGKRLTDWVYTAERERLVTQLEIKALRADMKRLMQRIDGDQQPRRGTVV